MPLKFDSDAAFERWVRETESRTGAYAGPPPTVDRTHRLEPRSRAVDVSARAVRRGRGHVRKLASRPIGHLTRRGHRRRARSVLATLLGPFR